MKLIFIKTFLLLLHIIIMNWMDVVWKLQAPHVKKSKDLSQSRSLYNATEKSLSWEKFTKCLIVDKHYTYFVPTANEIETRNTRKDKKDKKDKKKP